MKKIIVAMALAAAAILPAKAQDFFDTDDADRLFNIGVRVGVNTSNRTLSDQYANIWNQNAWGTGFDAGVIADINFKNYISIQPGFFYESRSGSFAYQSSWYTPGGDPSVKTQLGKGREYLFTIPVLASVHFNIIDELRWNVEFGPYLQIKLKSTFDDSFEYPEVLSNGGVEFFDGVKTSGCDFGFKMGTTLDIFTHYNVGVHYMAGVLRPWNPGKLGGHNKEWLFTIGYNF